MRFHEPTPEQEQGWKEWLASRPDHVREVAERFDPWSLYWLHGDRVAVLAFQEADTGAVSVRVAISAQFNADNPFFFFEREVFGVSPDDLTPADLPLVS